MATAEELLKSLTTQPDPEGHIVVGGDRFIKVPDNLKRLGVQYDHNMETVVFDCPRYWDNRDMSQMVVYINYMLSDGYADRYPADNVKADGDIMHFEWTISKNVTQTAGKVSFLVCVMKTDTEGNEERHWNTELCQDCYISPGMETEETSVELYPDEITQLLLRMASVEQINVQAEEMRTLYENTQAVAAAAEETKNQALDASNYIKNSYAPAIKGNVYGEIVRVDDVSPIEHDVKCWVHGKNLFNTNDYVNETDYSNNKTIYAINADHLVIGRTYTVFSSVPMQWFKISNSATGYSCVGLDGGTTGFTSYTFVHTRNVNILETSRLKIYVNNLERTAMYDLSVMESMNICIVEGSVPTTYEPYLDPTTVKLIRAKRNLFKVGTVADYQYIGDMYISGDAIYCSITSSNSSHVINTTNKYPSGSYTLRFDYADSSPRVLLRLYSKDGNVVTSNTILSQNGFTYNDAYKGFFKNGREISLTISDDVACWCLGFVFPVTTTAPVGSSKNVYNVRLQYGDDTNIFEMYDGDTIIPNPDGSCIVTSKSPTMTLFTDTPGILVEAEYNRDTTKMFESYVLTDEAKSEIASMVENDMAEVLASLNEYATSLIGGDA